MDSPFVSLAQETGEKPSFEIELSNYLNSQYIGDLYLGGGDNNHVQKVPVIFDTAQNWIWVKT